MKWLDILKVVVSVLVPIVNPALGALSPLILHGISEAEGMKGATGTQKLASVVDLVNTGVAVTNQAAGKQIVDPVVVNKTSGDTISLAVDVTNLIHKNQPTTSTGTTV